MTIGTVSHLRRYPVKSMGGETPDMATVTSHGLAGDRAYALFDPADRKVGSAKNVRGFPGLLDCRATYLAEFGTPGTLPPIEISHRDGSRICSDDPSCADVLSSWFGHRVALGAIADDEPERPAAGRYAMAGTFFDYAPLHILAETAMASLAATEPESTITIERFRPNLVIATSTGHTFPENEWVGRRLRIGDQVMVRVTDPCPRCAMTTLAQGELPADPRVLKNIARQNTVFTPLLEGDRPCLGAYAFVEQGGNVRVGDVVRMES